MKQSKAVKTDKTEKTDKTDKTETKMLKLSDDDLMHVSGGYEEYRDNDGNIYVFLDPDVEILE